MDMQGSWLTMWDIQQGNIGRPTCVAQLVLQVCCEAVSIGKLHLQSCHLCIRKTVAHDMCACLMVVDFGCKSSNYRSSSN